MSNKPGSPDGLRTMAMTMESDEMRAEREIEERNMAALVAGELSPESLMGLRTFIFKFNNRKPEEIAELNKQLAEYIPVLVQGLIVASRIPRETLYANGHPTLGQNNHDPIKHLEYLARDSKFAYSETNKYDWENAQRLLEATAKSMDVK